MVPEYKKPQNIRELATRLSDLGYWPVPIPAGCKGPVLDNWQSLRLNFETIPDYFNETGMLVGILHVNMLALDIDVYDEELSQAIVAEALRRFPGALERIGEWPKSALFLRMEEPGFKIRATKKRERDNKSAQVDVRSASRQTVVYGRHPSTQKPYRWPRGDLWETPRHGLPEATQAEVERFRDWCQEQIDKWSGVTDPKITQIDHYPRRVQDDEKDEAQFLEALGYVPSDCGYDDWLAGLMAIHDFYDGSAHGLQVAKDWSADYPDYDSREVEQKWKSFEVGKGVTYRSIFSLAQMNGANLSAIAKARSAGDGHKADDLSKDFTVATGSEHQFREMTDEERDEIEPLDFKPWGYKNLAAIPYPEIVYSDFYARGYTSVTLAPPKVGKSMLGLAEALDIASGRGFLTGEPRPPLRVLYYNAEDDQSVIDSRVAALLEFYQIDQAEIAETLYPISGVEHDDFFMISGQEGVINERLFVRLEKFTEAQSADVLIFDPLQDLSHSPETNEVFRLLGQRLRRMASVTGVALGLIHHTRKIAPGQAATIEDGRGGSALRGTARFNRLLVSMTEDEAAKAGVDNHRHYLRIGDAESNLAPPSADVNRWFEKVSVPIPNGRNVGAIRPWDWPDAFDGVTRHDAARVRSEIDRMAEPPRLDVRSGAWVGHVVADVLGINLSRSADKARVKSIVSKWMETDVLREAEGRDARAGRPTKIVICGATDPLKEESQ